MHFDLFTTDPALQPLASDCKVPTVEPLSASSWVAASVAQKAIRRGDVDLATRAALALLDTDAAKLWRRLAGIAFEDIGLADLECVRLVMAATAGKGFRQQYGGEHRVAGLVVARMCVAKKCRSADDLFIAVSHHHELEEVRTDLAREDLSQHLRHLRERRSLLGLAVTALNSSGVRWNGRIEGKAADAAATFAAMLDAGIDDEIVALAEQGFRRTREALPVLLPLLTLAMPAGELPSQDDEFPPVVIGRNSVPTYCYDAFSWEGNPMLNAERVKHETTGYEPWTEADITKFRAHWKEGTPQRTAVEILLFTGLRRSDAVRIGRQHIQGDRIEIKARKTGTELSIPIHPEFRAVLDTINHEHLVFIVTAYGAARSEKAFTNWIIEAARDAGLPAHRSPHGLRKAACRRLAEAGCSASEIMSITGHRNLAEVETYVRDANKKKLADSAISKAYGAS